MNQQALQARADDLAEVHAAGYAAYAHPDRDNAIVIADPVYCWCGGVTRTEYEHRTVRVGRDVTRFLLARS